MYCRVILFSEYIINYMVPYINWRFPQFYGTLYMRYYYMDKASLVLYNKKEMRCVRMASTEAQRRASKKWQDEKVDDIRFRVPKGKRAMIQEHASARGESVNAFLNRAVDETIERDSKE